MTRKKTKNGQDHQHRRERVKRSQRHLQTGRTFTCGNFSKNCFLSQPSTVRPFAGWTGREVFSKLKTAFELPNYGASVKTGRPWITTSSAVPYANTIVKASWRKRNDRKGSSINFASPTPCKTPTTQHFPRRLTRFFVSFLFSQISVIVVLCILC